MDRLFVYGVLIRELARGRAAELIATLGEGQKATARGRLHAIRGEDGGWYPILLPDAAGGTIHGQIHDAGAVDWSALDAFEDAHDGPDAEYARAEIAVMLADGSTTSAFAYCYARPLPGDAEPVPGGDFAAWLRENGREPFGSRGAAPN